MSRPNATATRVALALLLALGGLLAAGCDSGISVDIGAIRVTVTANGNNLDPDGYVIRVTGNGVDQSRDVDVNDQVLFGVPSGSYTVELTGRANNCVVDNNPQGVQVSSGDTADVLFRTLCG